MVAKQLLAQAVAGKDRAEKEKAAKDAALKAKLEQAKKDLAAGNYDKAIAALNEILKEDPNNAEAKQLLNQAIAARNKAANEKAANLTNARNALNKGNYDDAIAAANKVLEKDPNNAEAKKLLEQAQAKKQQEADRNAKLAQAKKDAANGNYDDAIAALNQILKNNPNDADARALLSQVTAAKNKQDQEAKEKENELANQKAKQAVEDSIAKGKEALAKGNTSDALNHFNNAKNSLPKNDDAYAAEKLGDMAKTLYDASANQGNPQTKATLVSEAVKDANAALAKDSKNAPAHYVLGMQAMDAKNYAEAEKQLKLAAENDPKNSIYWYQLGRAQAMQSKFDAAATSFKTSINLNSKYAPAHYNLGYVSEKSGNKTQALTSYQNAYKVDPNYERAYLASGRLMAADGNYSGAVKEFDKAIAINPSNAQTYQEQGSAYSNIGNYKSAETAYKKALAYMDPSKPDPATYYNISTVLYAQGKDTEAYTYAKQAYDNKSSAAKSLQVNCIYNYGLLCETTGKKEQAMSLYEEALTLDNKHVKSKINIGALYLEKGDVETALAFLNSAYAQDKNSFEANNNLGNAYAQKGDYTQAVTYYQNALKINPKDNTVRENLAKAYASSGQYQSAKVTYEDVIASDPENWSSYLELAKVDISLGETEDAIEKLTYLQTHNPSYMRTEVSSLLYTLR